MCGKKLELKMKVKVHILKVKKIKSEKKFK